MILSRAGMRVLIEMQDAEKKDNLYDAEIVCFGRYCYVGLECISKATVNELLRLVLIHDDSDAGGGMERYSLNEEGRVMVSDPHYIPKIIAIINANI